MGNGASVEPEGYDDEDAQVTVSSKVKPRKEQYAYVEDETTSPNLQGKQQDDVSSETRKTTTVKNMKMEETTNFDDDSPMQVLLEFIPYYGKEDPANDALVRSALSNLSIAEIDGRDAEGNTLLLLACQYGCEDLVRMMLLKGADSNAQNSHGVGCLHFACYRESASASIAKLLLKHGAHPEIQESTYGCTPLHYCAGNGDIDFCKLLITHGAQSDTYDYYNYTCVDYAREAGMNECANYLQQVMVKTATNKAIRVSSQSGANSPSTSNQGSRRVDSEGCTWQQYFDPQHNQNYLIHSETGECLWEVDFQAREEKSKLKPKDKTAGYNNKSSVSPEVEQWVVTKACRARLVGLFSKVDPTRLVEVDTLLNKYIGNEQVLMEELASKYNINGDVEYIAFQKKLREMKGLPEVAESPDKNNKSLTRTNSAATMDPMVAQALVLETSQKYENQIETLKAQFKIEIAEKEGKITLLQTQLDIEIREKNSLMTEKITYQGKLSSLQTDGSSALQELEDQLLSTKKKYNEANAEISQLKNNLDIEQDRLKSLESSLSSLTTDNAGRIETEKRAAEERAQQQKEREIRFAKELADAVSAGRDETEKVKHELQRVKKEHERVELGIRDEFDKYKIETGKELSTLKIESGNRISALTQELAAARLECAETTKRADAAEALQRLMQNEIIESRQVQQFNAQLHKDLAREQAARKRLHNEMEDLKGRIRVYVRVRPFSRSEVEKNSTEAVYKDGKLSVVVKIDETKKTFDFDQVFGGSSSQGNSQEDIFRDTKHLVMSVVDGYNVCIFAYGQTGSGKTFTMIGAADIGSCLRENGDFDELAGITPRAISELFRLLNERSAQLTYVVEVCMFQLYRDGLDDLLAERNQKKKGDDDSKPAPLKIVLAEHSPTGLVMVEGAVVMPAETPADVMRIFALGSARRTTASTQMNAESSRSHLICALVVKQTNRRTGVTHVGKLTLVDLAGSERVDKSGATGEQLKEAQSINKSLSAIGDVISALTSGSAHIPYRNHPLTMLMSDSLGGNAKTLMFVNTSPADYNTSESTSSLNFGLRCKDITNSVSGPGAGGAQSQQQLKDLKKELAKLKKDGSSKKAGVPSPGGLARPV